MEYIDRIKCGLLINGRDELNESNNIEVVALPKNILSKNYSNGKNSIIDIPRKLEYNNDDIIIIEQILKKLTDKTVIFINNKDDIEYYRLEDAINIKKNINGIIVLNRFAIETRTYQDIVYTCILYKIALRMLEFNKDNDTEVSQKKAIDDEIEYLKSLRGRLIRDKDEMSSIRQSKQILDTDYYISASLGYDQTLKQCRAILGDHAKNIEFINYEFEIAKSKKESAEIAANWVRKMLNEQDIL